MAMIQAGRTRLLGRISSGLVLLCSVAGFGQGSPDQAPELPLVDAIQIALGNNRPVQVAKLDVTKSGWDVAEAKTHKFPELKTEMLASGLITAPVYTYPEGIFGTINNQPVPSKNVEISLSNGVTGYAIATATQPISQLYQLHLGIREKELRRSSRRKIQAEEADDCGGCKTGLIRDSSIGGGSGGGSGVGERVRGDQSRSW
jgi:hypothetical protein